MIKLKTKKHVKYIVWGKVLSDTSDSVLDSVSDNVRENVWDNVYGDVWACVWVDLENHTKLK